MTLLLYCYHDPPFTPMFSSMLSILLGHIATTLLSVRRKTTYLPTWCSPNDCTSVLLQPIKRTKPKHYFLVESLFLTFSVGDCNGWIKFKALHWKRALQSSTSHFPLCIVLRCLLRCPDCVNCLGQCGQECGFSPV